MKLMMVRWLRYLLLGLCLALPLGARAHVAGVIYTPEIVPNVFAQDSLQLLSDPSNNIDEASKQRINELLLQLRLSTGVEFAVVIVDDIESDIETFSTRLFRLWGLGSKTRNDGLLLVLVLEKRKMRFEVGYGLEGTLPDAFTAQIQRREMIPRMKEGDYVGAIIAGIQAVQEQITSEGYTSDRRTARGKGDNAIPSTFLLFFYVIFVASITYSAVSSFHGKVAQLSSDGRILLSQRDEVRRTYDLYSFFLAVVCLPAGVLFWLYQRGRMKALGHQTATCPSCHQQTLRLLPRQETETLLTPPQRLEERLHSMIYQACACSSCGYEETIGKEVAGSKWQKCSRCGTRASTPVRQERVRGPRGGRYIRTYTHCQYCSHEDHQDRRDHSDDNAALGALLLSGLLSGGRHRGGGGSGWGGGGGFSGGSFGGGSSGGGGSTGSW